ncbi:hypothetical protein ABT093_03750 [Kitasatospora sp. NPDC002551]|uniref:hypothetical protein n=1 Tax=Kitasatospora sp. NPDC002551 TaxID=3154539 RepID=UPI00332D0C7B
MTAPRPPVRTSAGPADAGGRPGVGIRNPSTGETHLRVDNGTIATLPWGQPQHS